MRYAIYVNGQEVENGTEPSTGGSIQGLPAGIIFHVVEYNVSVLQSTDGFLVLGHDVDRYSPNDEIPIWDKYGFEKMQSFSGAMSQLNFWRQWIPDTQIKDMAFCKGANFCLE